MRTSQLVNVLSQNIKNIKIEKTAGSPLTNGQPGPVLFKGINSLKYAIHQLESAGLLVDQIDPIKNTILYQTGADSISVNYSESSDISNRIRSASLIGELLLDALSSTIKDQPSDSINVRLPDSIKDFHDLEKFSHDLHIALSQTVIEDEIGGKVEITGVENGSIWLQIFLGSSAAVLLVGSLVWAAMVIYKKKQEGDLLAQQVRGLGIRNTAVEEIQQAQQALLKEVIDAEANHINEENYDIKNPERVERLKHSIELFSKLIEKGTEIYPSLAAPENVSNLFPNINNLTGVVSKIKQIGNQ
ncbi:hypothetical protein GCM10023186_01270 [Hymenobacter koreensis]|uniref:Uncharacterized protein n=2 Tax=Hymenobacter koreensis TaxID=1084523 RepID=A0ABP8ITW7_9BACT